MDEDVLQLVSLVVTRLGGLSPDQLENATMRGALRLPDYTVTVWIKQNENFSALRSEVLAAAGAEPYEMTEYQGMADFHWGTTNIINARNLAEALKLTSQQPEVVLLRITSPVVGMEPITIKDERDTKH